MSTITKMRRWSKFLLIIVAAAFIAGFLMNELWQILGRRSGRNMLEKGIVGKVGNKNITMQEYTNTIDYLTVKFKTENKVRELSKADEERIRQETWQYITQNKMWQDILKKSRITITDPELIEIIKANPPQELRTNPELMTNGEFDFEKYQQYMFSEENRLYLTLYARELVDNLPREKFRLDVINSYRVTSNEIDEARQKDNVSIKVTYLFLGPKVLTERYAPTEEEIKTYYDKNKAKYQEEARYRVRYIYFPLTTTSRDSLELERQMSEIFQYAKSEDFTVLTKEFSDTPNDTQARWIKTKDLDEFSRNAINAAAADSITEPFLVFNNWQIIKIDKKARDSVLIRKITKTIQITRETEYALTDSINNFLSKAHSVDFDTLCAEYGIFPREMPPMNKERLSFPSLYNQNEMKDFVLSAKSKQLSRAMKGRGGYYIFQLIAFEPKKVQALEQVKSSVEWQVRKDKEKELMQVYTETAMEKARNRIPLEQIAQSDSLIELQTELFNSMRECRNRKGSEFAGTAYALNPGETFGILVTDIGSFIIRCDEKTERPDFDELIFRENRKTEVGNRIFQQTLKQPEIFDYRDANFF